MSLTQLTKSSKSKNNLMISIFKISTIISFLVLFSLMVTVSSLLPTTINNFFGISNSSGWQFYSIKIYLVIVLILLLIAAIFLVMVAFLVQEAEIRKNIIVISLLAIFSINICALIVNLFNYYQYQKLQLTPNLKIKFSQQIKIALGIRKWLIIDYALIGTFTALTLACAFIEENFLPHLPYGGGIALKYIPLIVISYTIGFCGGWVTGMISALMSLLFASTYVISPWSYLLDYFLPMTTPAIVALLRFDLKADKNICTYVNYFFHCFLICLIIYFWQTISGYFIWAQIIDTQNKSNIWPGFTPLFYSLVYNFIHIFLFTYPLMQLLIPFIYRGLVSYYVNRYR